MTASVSYLTSDGEWRELGWVDQSSLKLEPIVEDADRLPAWPPAPFSIEFRIGRPKSKRRRRRERRRLFALLSGGIVRPLATDGSSYHHRCRARRKRR